MTKATNSSKRRPDKHDLYHAAVQCPEAEIDFIDRVFSRLKGRRPVTLREDFSFTGQIACEWVKRRPANVALALDLDPAPLQFARSRIVPGLTQSQQGRVFYHQADVLEPPPVPAAVCAAAGSVGRTPGFDVIAALNFSYWVFQDRGTLIKYFQSARRQLNDQGLLVLDFMGGAECHLEASERSRRWLPGFGPFTYIWEHAVVDPISARTVCKIHFEFPTPPARGKGARGPGGGRASAKPAARGARRPMRFPAMRNAFTYDWRLWAVRELCDAIADAGYSRSRVFWEGEDKNGHGNGVFREQASGTADRSYVGYIVAEG